MAQSVICAFNLVTIFKFDFCRCVKAAVKAAFFALLQKNKRRFNNSDRFDHKYIYAYINDIDQI